MHNDPPSIIPQGNLQTLTVGVAERLQVPIRDAREIVYAVLEAISAEVRVRGKLAMKNFGTLERRIRKGRSYKHPLTGASIPVGDKPSVTFKPSDQLVHDVCQDDATRVLRRD